MSGAPRSGAGQAVPEVVLSGARLTDGSLVDVQVAAGVVQSVLPAGRGAVTGTPTVHALDGALLLPSLVEPHAHLDKAMSADAVHNETGDLDGAILGLFAAMGRGAFHRDVVAARARRALEQLIANGVTLVRSHADVLEATGGERVGVLAELKREYAELIDLEIVALVGSPITGRDGAPNRRALAAALAAGADVVGGCPHLDSDPMQNVSIIFDAAEEAGLPIDIHNDETLDVEMMTLPTIVAEKQRRGFERPVAASHCVSLSVQPVEVQVRIARLLAAADVAVIPQPATNLYLQARGVRTAAPRAIGPIDVLVEHGVAVAVGGDNVQDPFNPLGRGDPLEAAFLAVLAAHQQPERAYDLVSNAARRVLGRPPAHVAPGCPADFLAVDSGSIRQAVAGDIGERRVFRGGRLVAVRTASTRIERAVRG